MVGSAANLSSSESKKRSSISVSSMTGKKTKLFFFYVVSVPVGAVRVSGRGRQMRSSLVVEPQRSLGIKKKKKIS